MTTSITCWYVTLIFIFHFVCQCRDNEFTLAKLEKKRGGPAALKQGYQPLFSEIYLRYGSRRSLHFRAGAECPAPPRSAASRLFAEHAGKHEIRVYDDALDFIAQIRDGELRGRVIDEGSTWKFAAYDTLARDLELIAGWSPDVMIALVRGHAPDTDQFTHP